MTKLMKYGLLPALILLIVAAVAVNIYYSFIKKRGSTPIEMTLPPPETIK